ncbi:membrane integrity-associated transporter subunit PqiC [Sneathiella sp.]|uniref:PqiC family protein n=1 Tax=Sneathiella sp. TaxID=1964365 RepID=UPI003568CF3E
MVTFRDARSLKTVFWLVFIAMTLTACAGLPGSDPTRFYVLKPATGLTPENSLGELGPGINVGIGPVQVPGYADRSQIITFDSGNRITVSDFDHWAEPLTEAIKRVVSADMANLIGDERVFSYPADFRPDEKTVQVFLEIVDITQLDNGTARLAVRWHVKKPARNEVVFRHAGVYEMQATSGDYNSYADALTELLGRLAVDITGSLSKLDFQ